MSDIVLSAGVRANLLQLQQTSDLISQTQTRLATGKRVNSALDNAHQLLHRPYSSRANDLNGLLDSMSNGINTIQAANNGITAITKLVQSAQALTSQANQTTDTTVRATLASQFDALVTQIGQLATDSGFNGTNLLAGDTLTVTLDETGASSTSVVGVNYTDATAAPLSVALSAGSWASSANIQAATDSLTTALTSLRSRRSQTLSANLVDRADPSGFHQSDDQHPADRFFDLATLAELETRKAPNLLALQTRQQLSTTALSLASQADQNVLSPVPISRTAT